MLQAHMGKNGESIIQQSEFYFHGQGNEKYKGYNLW